MIEEEEEEEEEKEVESGRQYFVILGIHVVAKQHMCIHLTEWFQQLTEVAGVHVKQQSEVMVGRVPNQLSRASRYLKEMRRTLLSNAMVYWHCLVYAS